MRLIDADKLLEKTECLFKDLNNTEDYMGIGYNHGVGDSIAIIKNAPTIEAEPVKHGRWETEVRTVLGAKVPFFACSVCGSNADDEYAYCPHCGAKMNTEEGEGHEQN